MTMEETVNVSPNVKMSMETEDTHCLHRLKCKIRVLAVKVKGSELSVSKTHE